MLKNRLTYGGVVFIAVMLLLFYHHYFFFLTVVTLVALPVISIVLTARVARGISLEMSVPSMTIEEGNYAKIVFTVKNAKKIPLPAIICKMTVENRFYHNEEVQEMTFPVRRQKGSYTWSICPVYAGSIVLKPLEVYVWDYFRIFKKQVELPREKELISLPKKSTTVVRLLEMFQEEGEEIEKDALNSVEDVTSIKELRAYRPGDRLQRVHWKLSTKQDDLLVKEFERELNRTITLLLELKEDDDTQVGNLDLCMRAIYSTALYLLEEEQIFEMKWFDMVGKKFCESRVDSLDRLEDTMQQIFRMTVYPERESYRHYMDAEKGKMDMAIYFTDKGFSEYSQENLLGVFENKVLIVCI